MGDVLVKYDGSWADEIELQGFLVMTDKEWKDYKADVTKRHKSTDFAVQIGTNEEVLFADADDYFDSFEVKKISDEEGKVFRKFFKSSFFYVTADGRSVKLSVALNGTMALFLPEEIETDEDEDDDLENYEEASYEEDS